MWLDCALYIRIHIYLSGRRREFKTINYQIVLFEIVFCALRAISCVSWVPYPLSFVQHQMPWPSMQAIVLLQIILKLISLISNLIYFEFDIIFSSWCFYNSWHLWYLLLFGVWNSFFPLLHPFLDHFEWSKGIRVFQHFQERNINGTRIINS